jgi:hypothetical protein
MRHLLAALLLFATACGMADAQNYGPRSGPVTWTYTLDAGNLDGGFVDAGLTDGGNYTEDGGFLTYDGGVCADGGTGNDCNFCQGSCSADGGWLPVTKQSCYLDGGFGTIQGPYTCTAVWNDAGYNPGNGGYNDGGFSDGGCTDAGVIRNGQWNCIVGDAGPINVQNPYFLQDGGWIDAGFGLVLQQNYSWLPVSAAIYNGSATSDPITFAGFTTAAGCHVTFNQSASSGAAISGLLCLELGYPPSNFQDAGLCLHMDGGLGPYTWDVGPIYTPATQFTYVPGTGSDGGYLYGTFSVTNY